jgi:hypothetical protein
MARKKRDLINYRRMHALSPGDPADGKKASTTKRR